MSLLICLLIGLLPVGGQVRVDTTSGGVGPVTPTTFATFVARNTVDFGPLTLQVLVLWHGETNWFTDRWSHDEKGIRTATRLLEYRIDDDSVTIEGQKIALAGINVVLVEVDGKARVVETLYIDPVIPEVSGVNPVSMLLRRNPRLAAFAELEP